jgi:UPF0755 protein
LYFPDGEQNKQPRHGRRLRRRGVAIIIAASLVVVGGAGVALYATGTLSTILHPVADYSSDSGAEVQFTIAEGDGGQTIAENLAAAGIVKSFDAFYKLLVRTNPEPVFIPGVYTLKAHMSAQSALAALTNQKNRLVNQVVIPEGTILPKVLVALSQATKIPVADFEAVTSQPQTLGLPAEAKTAEGFLFPATYNFSPNQSAKQILQTMVDRTMASLDKAGVAPADRFKVITKASLVQKESGSVKDMYKVSRVFTNRLDETLWPSLLLESDATVAYGTGNTNKIETTPAQRADASNIYNTYVHPGPLAAPICNPGDSAIDAALHPAAGKWLYFVAVNFDTGETVFSETLAQHEAAVAKSQEWWRAHPEYQ